MKTNAGALLSSLRIDRGADRKISIQLYMGLKEILLSGGVAPGDRLPASRILAKEIGVSRTTVIDALERLTADGLLEARVGDGTYVSRALAGRRSIRPATVPAAALPSPPRLSHAATHAQRLFAPRAWLPHRSQAFITALPALDLFPMAHWARLAARHWRGDREEVMGYGHPSGYQGLREAVATHLNAARGIKCDPEQVFILKGTLLLNPGHPVWFENPVAIGARNPFVAGGASIVPVEVDDEGLSVADGLRKAPHFRLAFATPSHQQPLGRVMSLTRRLALLRAAEDAGALIVEDDYDGEFYYGSQPQPPLKSIDTQERVIYVGTFSKTLFPSLRLGFILVPQNLVRAFAEVSASWLSGVPTATQSVVADFMNEGLFSTHIRLMRRAYKARHDALIEAAEGLAPWIDVRPTSGGFHTVGFLADDADEDAIVAGARARGVVVAGLSRYCSAPIGRKGLVLGFGGVDPDEIRRGVLALEALSELAG